MACLLMIVCASFSNALANTSQVSLTEAQVDSLARYETMLYQRAAFLKFQADSLEVEVSKAEIEIAALKANQRKWYDELVVFVKVLALALAAKWLNDG